MTNIDIPESRLFGLRGTFERVNKSIASGDSMFGNDNLEYYFPVGASATASILEALAAAKARPDGVSRVLDYACGYGRVLRWLRAQFRDAYLLGVDADAKAAASASATLSVDARPLDISLSRPLDEPFDLIWVGSLLTHLPEEESLRVLTYLEGHLTPGGVLVFSTHGQLVFDRLKSRERLYGLSDAGGASVVDGYREHGYGFSSYPHISGYGISAAKPSNMISMIEACTLRAIYFKAQGWVSHHDVYGCVRS